jgi:hypothetical protein
MDNVRLQTEGVNHQFAGQKNVKEQWQAEDSLW